MFAAVAAMAILRGWRAIDATAAKDLKIVPSQEESPRPSEQLVRPSCFGNQMSDVPGRDRVEDATVKLSAMDPRNRQVGSGTGIVVKGSGDAVHPENRILTAGHVFDLVRGTGYKLVATTSSGISLGVLVMVARGKKRPQIGPKLSDGGDLGILRLANPTGSPMASYFSIEGLELAHVKESGFLQGEVEVPFGVGGGASGGGLLNEDGRVMAVVVSTSAKLDERTVLVRAPDPQGKDSVGGLVNSQSEIPDYEFKADGFGEWEDDVPEGNVVFGEIVADPTVRAALNGASLEGSDRPFSDPNFNGVLASYPSGLCVAYRGAFGPMNDAWRSPSPPRPLAVGREKRNRR